jgi:hypothetical protein
LELIGEVLLESDFFEMGTPETNFFYSNPELHHLQEEVEEGN